MGKPDGEPVWIVVKTIPYKRGTIMGSDKLPMLAQYAADRQFTADSRGTRDGDSLTEMWRVTVTDDAGNVEFTDDYPSEDMARFHANELDVVTGWTVTVEVVDNG